MILRRTVFGMAVTLLAAGLIGCQQARVSTTNAEGPSGVFKLATGHDVQEAPYKIDPPDVLTIHAPQIKEIDNAKQTVRADGKISLNLVGEVSVVGLTTEQITAKIKELASKFYQPSALDIKVEVEPNSKFYLVFGAANVPSKKPFTGHDTIVRALAEAGFNDEAWPQQVLLSRPAKNGKDKATVVVDFTKIYEYGEMNQNYLLEEGDIIDVRISPLARLNQVTSRVLGPLTGATGAVGSVNSVRPTNGTP